MRLLHFLIGAMVLITTGCAQDSEGIYNGASWQTLPSSERVTCTT